MSESITIALDVMSGDNGPSPALLGSIKSLRIIDDLKITLIGNESDINPTLKDLDKTLRDRLKVIHTDQYIKMDEDIVSAIRNKKKSSMRLAIDSVKNKDAHACVSAGNTGALMSLSKILGLSITHLSGSFSVISVPGRPIGCIVVCLTCSLHFSTEYDDFEALAIS